MRKFLSDSDKQFIVDEYNKGIGSDSIAKKLNIHPNTVLKILKKKQIQIRPFKTKLSIQDKISICSEYLSSDKPSMEDLGKKYNVSSAAIFNVLKENKVKSRTPEESHRIYPINESFFDVIDSEEKAYFLGFLFADGCNQIKHHYSVVINLSEEDTEILYKFSSLIYLNKDEAINQVKIYDRKRYIDNNPVAKITKEAILSINSKHICGKLVDLGCVPNKTFLLKYPNYLPENLHRHFIRGYFDGDGSLNNETKRSSGLKIVSTKEFLDGIRDIIPCISSLYKNNLYDDKNTYVLNVSGNRNIQKFVNFIYSGSNIFLQRKYDKYVNFCNKMNEIDEKCLAGTRGYAISNVKKNYPDFYQPITIDNLTLTKDNIKKLNDVEKNELSYKILKYFRSNGFNFFINDKLLNDFDSLKELKLNNLMGAGNNLCTMLCKLYCKDYFKTKFNNRISVYDAFHKDDLLLRSIQNRLMLNWKSSSNEIFDISFSSIVRGFLASSVCYNISIFKPAIVKYICETFSNEGDVMYDYSAGWGTRMLGAAACNRKYIGVDPLTIPSLEVLKNDLELENVSLVQDCSENFKLKENSIDLAFSSPPFFDLEIYSNDKTQAYAKGEDYYYNVYWKNTLLNIKKGLKPNKWFGVNITKYPKIIEIATGFFGKPIEILEMYNPKIHLHKNSEKKNDYIYMFKNNK